eukprot:COSAG01_NODE_6809_length_3487_cov_8.018890_2_plen_232_part_00
MSRSTDRSGLGGGASFFGGAPGSKALDQSTPSKQQQQFVRPHTVHATRPTTRGGTKSRTPTRRPCAIELAFATSLPCRSVTRHFKPLSVDGSSLSPSLPLSCLFLRLPICVRAVLTGRCSLDVCAAVVAAAAAAQLHPGGQRPGTGRPDSAAVSTPFFSFNGVGAVLTEIHLCHARVCQEKVRVRVETAPQVQPLGDRRRARCAAAVPNARLQHSKLRGGCDGLCQVAVAT